jgi:hypothetical protein
MRVGETPEISDTAKHKIAVLTGAAVNVNRPGGGMELRVRTDELYEYIASLEEAASLLDELEKMLADSRLDITVGPEVWAQAEDGVGSYFDTLREAAAFSLASAESRTVDVAGEAELCVTCNHARHVGRCFVGADFDVTTACRCEAFVRVESGTPKGSKK